jgi:hypothetical protein
MADERKIPDLPVLSDEELAARTVEAVKVKLRIPEEIEPAVRERTLEMVKDDEPNDNIFNRVWSMIKSLFGDYVVDVVEDVIEEVEDKVDDVADDVIDRGADWLRDQARRRL